jgi:hypothetical protein
MAATGTRAVLRKCPPGRAGGLAAAAALLLSLGLAAPALAGPPAGRTDHRDFAGKVSKVSRKRVTVENRMGDRRSFVRGEKTRVRGGRESWDGIRQGDEVIVDWHLEDRPARARRVRVIPPR